MNSLYVQLWKRYIIFVILLSASTGQMCLAAQDTAKEKLEKAREDFRLSIATQKRIAADIEALRRSENTSPEILREYENYLKNVSLMVEENQRVLESMEAALARRTGGIKDTDKYDSDPTLKIVIPEEKKVDKLTALDRELNESLAEFDDMLLKELELIRAKSAEKMRDFALEAADSAKRLKEQEAAHNEAITGGNQEISEKEEHGSDQERYDESGRKTGTDSKRAGYEQNRSRPGKNGDTQRAEKRKSSTHQQDDDIVARQLREAAENETDPELREKLWQKYEEYKNSTSK